MPKDCTYEAKKKLTQANHFTFYHFYFLLFYVYLTDADKYSSFIVSIKSVYTLNIKQAHKKIEEIYMCVDSFMPSRNCIFGLFFNASNYKVSVNNANLFTSYFLFHLKKSIKYKGTRDEKKNEKESKLRPANNNKKF